ncbi:MAG: carbonic anhydrase [Dehalococcoidia bacterium]|nr:MAG: carbonic anhydrase [Dehalococcoidia bacterium]
MSVAKSSVSRREILRSAAAITSAIALGGSTAPHTVSAQGGVITPEEALTRLQAGNARFVTFTRNAPTETPDLRGQLAGLQRPIAAIISCADSRVPPEIVFDAELGELFVVRVAGNVWDDIGVGSVEFAVANFGTPLIVVMGHQRCGAVAASLDAIRTNTPVPGVIGAIVEAMRPPVEATLAAHTLVQTGRNAPPLTDAELVELACIANIRYVVDKLSTADLFIAEAQAAGQVKIVGMYFSLDTGEARLVT